MSRINERTSVYREETQAVWSVNTGDDNPSKVVNEKMTEPQINDGHIIKRQVQISNKMGLHARPAMQFVDLANKFNSRITIHKQSQRVNAKSIMELLLLAATDGTELTIEAEGDDAADATNALVKLVESKFGEE